MTIKLGDSQTCQQSRGEERERDGFYICMHAEDHLFLIADPTLILVGNVTNLFNV